MAREIYLSTRAVGVGHPVFIVAEIGINHNGEISIAKDLIRAAKQAGCDAVKFQKRTPKLCVPEEQKGKMRDTPWGYITYLEYKEKIEFSQTQYKELDAFCRQQDIMWFASCWDEPSVDFIENFAPPCYKIQSAAVTDFALLERLRATKRPLVLSTGMSTMDEITDAVQFLKGTPLLICHATSVYPCPNEKLNLKMISTLFERFPHPVGYSGHEVGLPTTAAAVALGASFIERHITLDRAMWGTDQASSVEPGGFTRLTKYIRTVEESLGDGMKVLYAEEIAVRERLKRS